MEKDSEGNILEESKDFLEQKPADDTPPPAYKSSIIIPLILGESDKERSLDNNGNGNFHCGIILPPSDKVIEQKKKKPERTGWQRYIGILLALCSCATFSLCIVIVKYLSGKFHTSSFGVYRFAGILFSFLLLLYFRYVKKTELFNTIWPVTIAENRKNAALLFLRGIAGASAILLQYSAVNYISIASATTICFSTPIFVGLFAWIFLGEKCGLVPAFAAVITFLGVLITAKMVPGASGAGGSFSLDNRDNLIGAGLALASMFCATAVFIILRHLRRVHFTIVTSVFGVIGIIESGILCAVVGRFDVPDSAWEWFLVGSLGVLTLISQTCMTIALKFEDAGPIALVRTSDVILSFMWQFIFFGQPPDLYSGLGALVVCLGVGLTAFRKYVNTLPLESSTRKTCSFVLR